MKYDFPLPAPLGKLSTPKHVVLFGLCHEGKERFVDFDINGFGHGKHHPLNLTFYT